MEREQSQDRMQSVLRLPAARRYSYFLQRVVESGEVWGLDGEGWALRSTTPGGTCCRCGPRPSSPPCAPTGCGPASSLGPCGWRICWRTCCRSSREEGMPVGDFFTPEGQGHPVTARELIDDLRTARGPLA